MNKDMQQLVEVDTAYDLGFSLFAKDSEMLLVEVCRIAARQFPMKDEQLAFASGYSAARAQQEAFQREKAIKGVAREPA